MTLLCGDFWLSLTTGHAAGIARVEVETGIPRHLPTPERRERAPCERQACASPSWGRARIPAMRPPVARMRRRATQSFRLRTTTRRCSERVSSTSGSYHAWVHARVVATLRLNGSPPGSAGKPARLHAPPESVSDVGSLPTVRSSAIHCARMDGRARPTTPGATCAGYSRSQLPRICDSLGQRMEPAGTMLPYTDSLDTHTRRPLRCTSGHANMRCAS